MGLEVGGLYLAECHKEHEEEQYGLEYFDHCQYVELHFV